MILAFVESNKPFTYLLTYLLNYRYLQVYKFVISTEQQLVQLSCPTMTEAPLSKCRPSGVSSRLCLSVCQLLSGLVLCQRISPNQFKTNDRKVRIWQYSYIRRSISVSLSKTIAMFSYLHVTISKIFAVEMSMALIFKMDQGHNVHILNAHHTWLAISWQ